MPPTASLHLHEHCPRRGDELPEPWSPAHEGLPGRATPARGSTRTPRSTAATADASQDPRLRPPRLSIRRLTPGCCPMVGSLRAAGDGQENSPQAGPGTGRWIEAVYPIRRVQASASRGESRGARSRPCPSPPSFPTSKPFQPLVHISFRLPVRHAQEAVCQYYYNLRSVVNQRPAGTVLTRGLPGPEPVPSLPVHRPIRAGGSAQVGDCGRAAARRKSRSGAAQERPGLHGGTLLPVRCPTAALASEVAKGREMRGPEKDARGRAGLKSWGTEPEKIDPEKGAPPRKAAENPPGRSSLDRLTGRDLPGRRAVLHGAHVSSG